MHLVLTNFQGTSSSLDDMAVWTNTGQAVPTAGEGWVHYDVEVPSSSAGLPKGWVAYEAGAIVSGAAADTVWATVIEQVDKTGWSWGAPLTPNLYSYIDSGMDNAAITRRKR